ncbi:HesB/IscA family protein [Phormidium sp. CCY1219]|uniref:HesB/IscA family protein n=1 Tax=Phormidium sp. CCY1219 TaxID=2886104 RepID=UPI002D1F082A|nr:iron-sulfur cluster assembly accessory protein [Phormidium sp. CCY1219]MEB3829433.1 iron-sulfur cluster assembly accessory protein [Phormidium sp. CCY1219]
MITLSQAASVEVNRLKHKRENPEGLLLRLGVQTGGCSGLYYTMEFDADSKPEDVIYECNGIKVAIERQNLEYLSDLSLDYSEDLMGGGFRFHNPNATETCSCGNSFYREDASSHASHV